jgi:hypothetical protein
MKVFHGGRLDFLDEDMARREMLVYLMNGHAHDGHLRFVRSIEPLNLDVGLSASYIRALINDSPENHEDVADVVEEVFHDVTDVSERLGVMRVIDEDYLVVEDGCDEE